MSFQIIPGNKIQALDPVDETSNLLNINTFDLSGEESIELNDISMTNSSISFFKIGSMINTPPATKIITVRNFAYTNSEIMSQRSLITTEGIVFNVDVSFLFDNVTFDNINFVTKGYLMRLSHQLTWQT